MLEIEGIVPWEEFRSLLKKKDWRRPNWGAPPGPDGEIYLPETEVVCNECRDLLLQISKKSARIEVRTKAAKKLAETTDTARRLQTMLGVGPMTVLPVEAFAPDMAGFRRGRDFAAWLGLVPRQRSLGGRERLGWASKAGEADIRKLLIIGATAWLTVHGRKSVWEGSWLARILAKKPKMLVTIALANRMARQLWAMMTKREDFREPVVAGVA